MAAGAAAGGAEPNSEAATGFEVVEAGKADFNPEPKIDEAAGPVDSAAPNNGGAPGDASSFFSLSDALALPNPNIDDDAPVVVVTGFGASFPFPSSSSDAEACGRSENGVCVPTVALGLLKIAELAKKFGMAELDFGETLSLC